MRSNRGQRIYWWPVTMIKPVRQRYLLFCVWDSWISKFKKMSSKIYNRQVDLILKNKKQCIFCQLFKSHQRVISHWRVISRSDFTKNDKKCHLIRKLPRSFYKSHSSTLTCKASPFKILPKTVKNPRTWTHVYTQLKMKIRYKLKKKKIESAPEWGLAVTGSIIFQQQFIQSIGIKRFRT